MEVLTGIANLKEEIGTYLASFDPSRPVTSADVHKIFENLAQKRRRYRVVLAIVKQCDHDRGYVVALASKEQYRSPLEPIMHATMPGVIFLEYGNVQVAK
ncbi:hypothetical protein H5410_063946 [Solanum commersonii]|uniref:Uncharacterized protein n=1 Tax=Solanum commersonii TaxID=4109 RepID=A0A9J5W108_SOLCO|nr:hypothetical protein H5410_063946 [Solanum commersonii]